MLKLSDKFPAFNMTATIAIDKVDNFAEISNSTYKDKWLVVFFYPKDFTFVCPTEISGFNDLTEKFASLGAQLLGASVDSEYVHLAWRKSHPDLKDLKFPLLSDIKRDLSTNLGILDEKSGVANRATFIVDPEGFIRYAEMTDMSVGRNPEETLRVLEALVNGGLCPCNWKKGENTL